jgi:zinc ribbon protein
MRNAIEPAGEVVCPNCSDANEAGADFCARCGAPVGRFTTLDPLKSTYAEGWLFRKAASARIKPIVLIGMWALLGVPVAAAAAVAILRPEGTPAFRILGSMRIGLIYLLVLARVTHNYIRNRPGPGPWDPDA